MQRRLISLLVIFALSGWFVAQVRSSRPGPVSFDREIAPAPQRLRTRSRAATTRERIPDLVASVAADETFAVLRNEFEQKFADETFDELWASAMEYALAQRLEVYLPEHSHIESIDCRRSLCRIHMIHPTQTLSEQFVNQTLAADDDSQRIGDALAGLVEKRDDGSVSQVIFLSGMTQH